MKKNNSFEKFAPAILKSYHRDKEAFWAAAMAPFLADTTILTMLQHGRVGAELFSAFKGLDEEARQILKDFSAPLDIDITEWKSNRPQYFKDAYPIFAFLAIWMDEQGLSDFLEKFDEILRAAVFAVAGYGILDENVDGAVPSAVEVLTSQALIAEYEKSVLQIFGVSPVNLGILHQMRSLFLSAEIMEKSLRGKRSPYRLEAPEECGTKGANAVTPFMLSLERLGKADLIDDYWRVFLLFGAAIQMIDDWTDLEKDLAAGHYSYVTLGFENLHDTKKHPEVIRLLRNDRERVRSTFDRSREMIAESRLILDKLNDPILARLVDVTDLRLDAYFRKELKMS